MPDSPVTIALIYPTLLGTYGDGGNATVLAQRLRWRGHRLRVLTVGLGEALPTQADLYVLGGGGRWSVVGHVNGDKECLSNKSDSRIRPCNRG